MTVELELMDLLILVIPFGIGFILRGLLEGQGG